MVVYYSLGGTTKLYAEILAELLNDTLVELKEKNPRKGLLGLLRGCFEALIGSGVALEALPALPSGKPVFVCSPIWAGKLSPAVVTFIKDGDFGRGKVNVVLTCANITGRDTYKKAVTRQLISQRRVPGFVEVFLCDRKLTPEKTIVRKHLKKLVLNVDESF